MVGDASWSEMTEEMVGDTEVMKRHGTEPVGTETWVVPRRVRPKFHAREYLLLPPYVRDVRQADCGRNRENTKVGVEKGVPIRPNRNS